MSKELSRHDLVVALNQEAMRCGWVPWRWESSENEVTMKFHRQYHQPPLEQQPGDTMAVQQ